MAHPAYLRDKARSLRVEKRLTIDELAQRLALPRTTIFYWVRDLPIPATPGQTAARRAASRAMQARFRRLRSDAYEEGRRTFAALSREPTFRDFVCLYVAEGYKRNRNSVAIGNSDPRVITIADHWVWRFARNPVTYSVQYHADQDLVVLRAFWAAHLHMPPEAIRLQRKSNSNQLAGRTWRSVHGVLTVRACDTLFRARLQGWMDVVAEEWSRLAPSGA